MGLFDNWRKHKHPPPKPKEYIESKPQALKSEPEFLWQSLYDQIKDITEEEKSVAKVEYEPGEKFLRYDPEDEDIIQEVQILEYSPSKKYIKILIDEKDKVWTSTEDFEVLEKL